MHASLLNSASLPLAFLPVTVLPQLLLLAVLLPLFSFFVILCGAKWLGKSAALVATGAIGFAGVLSFLCLFSWLGAHWPGGGHEHGAHESQAADAEPGGHSDQDEKAFFANESEPAEDAAHTVADADHAQPHSADEHAAAAHGADAHADHAHGDEAHAVVIPPHYTGEYYLLAKFGKLRLGISYYIDALTIVMFCMVTLIATCIHFYAMGYMHDELHDITDHEVTLADGHHLHRPGRFPRFFQALSLFCFSMLGLVLAGNIFMVFVFWELVGICSYFLIGFYVERKSASTAANKAFIVNRVGDFGMIIGLMALWSSLGTFAFGDIDYDKSEHIEAAEQGIFSQVRSPELNYALQTPVGMSRSDNYYETAVILKEHESRPDGVASARSKITSRGYGYGLLFIAGVGIFCGCIGKSAQFPLHVWLPDAMEGPTPVSALVHSATMVAAGVYLVGRFYPVFSPEVLLVIASVGCITLFVAATIAITATDIKRVLAYSTVSQLGYMMLALGVGGWVAGLMHLITHAFFKSLLFMCSGSVIHAVHTNDMRKMGGLFRKMPVTAITMLIGCLAIAGVGLPFVIGFSGYYSKDSILEQAYSFSLTNGSAWASVFFVAAAGGAAITAFYMFRMWYLTFVGKPRDQHAYDHAHESPPVMFLPLVLLSIFAIGVAWDIRLIGYGLVAAAFFIVKGLNEGWFKHLKSAGGHDDHGHDAHGHDSPEESPEIEQELGGLGRAETQPAAMHPVHHDPHAHDDHSGSTAPTHPGFTWAWTGTMVVCSIVGGLLVQALLSTMIHDDSPIAGLKLRALLEQAQPAGTLADMPARWLNWTWPNEHKSHAPAIATPVTLLATGTWLAGIGLATVMYALGYLSADDVRRQFSPIYRLLVNKWWFDELYAAIFVKPTLLLSRVVSLFDRGWIDWSIDNLGRGVVWLARRWEFIADRVVVDGLVNVFAGWTYSAGLGLKNVQTGRLRQYVLFIVVGAVALFILVSFVWTPTLAR